MKTLGYILGAHWASYLINGDTSGYDPHEIESLQQWIKTKGIGHCLAIEKDLGFCWGNDYDNLGQDCCVYTFAVGMVSHTVHIDGRMVKIDADNAIVLGDEDFSSDLLETAINKFFMQLGTSMAESTLSADEFMAAAFGVPDYKDRLVSGAFYELYVL